MTEARLYMDEAATTPLDPRVRDAMIPWLGVPANPHVRHHAFGAAAAAAVDQSRAAVAAAIGTDARAITFTSGATESSNLFFSGIAPALRSAGRTHIITTAVEHASILAPLAALDGFKVSVLPVQPCAMIESGMIERAITPQTGLISVQAVNNVTGTIQPLDEIAAMLRGRGILFHTDAAQAPGRIAFDVNAAGVDAASLCAHKIYGPVGIGALYLRPGISLAPAMHGGAQESGLRPGTLPAMLCAGFGAACRLLADDRARLQGLRERLLQRLEPFAPQVFGHTDPAWNTPGILALRFPGIDHETLIMALPDLAFSVGAACGARGGRHRNHVITAIAGDTAAEESIRLSFGRFTTEHDIDRAGGMIAAAVNAIRQTKEAA